MLSVAKAVEDKLDEQIAALDRLDPDDIEALRERRILQMRRAAERRAKWRALGHGEYGEVPEKEFFAAAKASDRLVCHFYRDNWPCKVRLCLLSLFFFFGMYPLFGLRFCLDLGLDCRNK